MKVEIRIEKTIEMEISPNQSHWDEADESAGREYVMNELKESFSIDDIVDLDSIKIAKFE